MVQLLKAVLLGAAVFSTASYAQVEQDCGIGFGKCPDSKPCCSQYGQCGIGAFCLGGCDPKFSNQLDSCVAAPVCQSKKHTFGGLTTVADKTKYLGDSSRYDWVADGKPKNRGDDLLLSMEPGTVGTVLASTAYVWYGKVTATMKTSRGKGVVSAFILLSDMKDEIDYEWVGADLSTTQTNYYFQGVPDYNNGGNITTSDTFDEWHVYEIDWTEDAVTWTIDGQVGRVLKKSDTFNSTTKIYNYPQTPSRVQLSIWPGGLATNDKGTVLWAGGEIDWVNNQDIKDPGYYYATVRDVTVTCYDPPAAAQIKGSKSYYYDDIAGLENNVVISDKGTVLKSFLGTGSNMDVDYPKAKAKPSSSSKDSPSSSSPSSVPDIDDIETVPGLSGAGTGANGNRGGSSASGSESVSGSGSGSSDSGTGSSGTAVDDQGVNSDSGSNVFSQGDTTDSNDAVTGRVLQGSLLAIVVTVAGVLAL